MSGALAAVLAGTIRVVSGARVRWLGGEPESGARVYFANHASHLDAAVLWSALPAPLRARTRPVAAKDYWDGDPVRRYVATRLFRALLVDRAATTREVVHAQLASMVAALEAGDSLILFPEGTRGTGAELAPFKSGLYHLARRRPETDLIPVRLGNLHRVLPKGEAVPVPLLSSVDIGLAFRIRDGEGKAEFLLRAREAIERLGAP